MGKTSNPSLAWRSDVLKINDDDDDDDDRFHSFALASVLENIGMTLKCQRVSCTKI